MTAERRQKVERIYEEATTQHLSQREAFLNRACAGDLEMRGEVDRMLAGNRAARESMAPGSRIGPYEIVSLLGAGGMGEVYKARDTRLNRTIAIKVLPQHAAGDAERRARLLREARTASVLNHPNIVTIHDVLSEGGRDSIVMEHVEGRTLKDVIAGKRLALADTLQYGMQIAGALAAAHAAGIVHRDLKPGNIMITKSGVKVLDFGLAKFVRTSVIPPQASETLTAKHVIVGTLSYMAPEQLAGQECDARTDIFALGLVLYEMIAGRRAFDGASREALMGEVMRCQPAPLKNVPPQIALVIERCLAREAAERWQASLDLRGALELAAISAVHAPPRNSTAPAAWLLALLAVAAILIAILWPHRGVVMKEPLAFTISSPEGATQIPWPGVPSPDGHVIAFLAQDASGKTGLWLRTLAMQTAQRLAGADDASGPFWSPDGLFLGFFAQGKLKRIAVAGGPAQNICNVSADLGASWNSTGDILLLPHNRVPLHLVSASGGTPRPITTLDTARGENSHRWPHFLPDGRHFLFTARSSIKENTGIYLGSLDSKEKRFLLAAQSNAQYAPPGYLLFGREGTLLAQRFDTRKLALEGDAFPVAGGIEHVTPSANALFAVSADGTVLSYQGENRATGQLGWFDRKGVNLGWIGAPGDYTEPRLSPDGKRVAVVVPEAESGNRDIWVLDLAGGRSTRFTFNPANDWWPVWSPDGASIAFASDRTAPSRIYRKALNGTGEEELWLARPDGGVFPRDWSSDGLLFNLNVVTTNALWILPVGRKSTPRVLIPPETWPVDGRYSPDGKWLAYSSNESGGVEIYVIPVGGGAKVRVSTTGGTDATWARGGRELFYLAPGGILMSAEIKAGQVIDVGAPRALFRICSGAHTLRGIEKSYDVTSDGKRVLVSCLSPEAKQRFISVLIEWQRIVKEPGK